MEWTGSKYASDGPWSEEELGGEVVLVHRTNEGIAAARVGVGDEFVGRNTLKLMMVTVMVGHGDYEYCRRCWPLTMG